MDFMLLWYNNLFIRYLKCNVDTYIYFFKLVHYDLVKGKKKFNLYIRDYEVIILSS